MSTGGRQAFVTTRWTRVLQARGNSEEAQQALSDLCEAYYDPVFAFVRWSSCDEDRARDLTQEFFARLLKRHSLGNADPTRGRFRSYLLASVKNFLHDMRAAETAAKRNPGAPLESIHRDTEATGHGHSIADPKSPNPEREFDRKWALALLDRSLSTLEKENEAAGKRHEFEVLKPWLTGDSEHLRQANAAEHLGMNESTLKVAVHRLRRRFRDLVKEEIAATLPQPDIALVADEMSYLVSILR